MAGSFNSSVSTTGVAVTSITTGTINSTGGTDPCFVAGAGSNDDLNAPSGITWNVATPENFTSQVTVSFDTYFAASMWTLIPSVLGTDDFTATWASSRDSCGLAVGYFEGIDQTTPVGDSGNATSNTGTGDISVTLTGAAADDMLVDTLFTEDPTGARTVGTNQTEREAVESTTASYNTGINMSTQDGADGNAMNYTKAASTHSIYMALLLTAAAGGGGGRIMSSLIGSGGLVSRGGIAGKGGGLAG